MADRTLPDDANELLKACAALEARAIHREKRWQRLIAGSRLALGQSRALVELSHALLRAEAERRHP